MPSSAYAIDRDFVEQVTVSMELGGPRPQLRKGNAIVVFDRHDGSLDFVGTSNIISSSIENVSDARLDLQKNVVTFGEIRMFDKPRPLNTIAGSLHRVYRFLEPQKHFKRRVNALSSQDYKTIVDYSLEIPRSIFRYLFSAIPLAIQSEFVRTYPRSFPLTAEGHIESYGELADELISFLDNRVGATLRLLTDVALAYEGITHAEIPPLSSLHLAPGRSEQFSRSRPVSENVTVGMIAFGISALGARRLITTNRLFGGGEIRQELLEECKAQLAEYEGKERRWTDPVF